MPEISKYDLLNNPQVGGEGVGLNKTEKETPIKGSPKSVNKGPKVSKYNLKDYSANTSEFSTGVNNEGEIGSNNTDIYVPGVNLNEERAARQGAVENIFSGISKGTGLLGSTLGNTFASLPYGIIKASYKGLSDNNESKAEVFSHVYDNGISQWFEKFNTNMEKWFPNYYSEKEQKADAFSWDNIGTSNFWGDKVLKNAGFTAGAILGGGVISKGIRGSSYLAKALVGANELTEGALLAQFNTLLSNGMEASAATRKVAQGVGALNRTAALATSTIVSAGEASAEALQAKAETKRLLDEQWKLQNPDKVLDAQTSQLHEQLASKAGNATFGVNMALLMGTETFQFGKLWAKGFTPELKRVEQLALKEGAVEAIKPSFKKRVASMLRSGLANSGAEAFEEGTQTATQAATKDYYGRLYDKEAIAENSRATHAVLAGLQEAFGTKDGLESMLLGAITGLGSHAITSGISKAIGKMQGIENDDSRATRLAQAMNAQFSTKLTPYLKSAIRAASINKDMEANANSDKPSRKIHEDLSHDNLKALVQPFIEADRFDILEDKLNNELVKDDAQFKEDFPDVDTKKNSKEYVSKIMKDARRLKSNWEDIQEVFPKVAPQVREKLWSLLSDVQNKHERVADLNLQVFAKSGVNFTEDTNVEDYLKQIDRAYNRGTITEKEAEQAKDIVEISQEAQVVADERKDLATNPASQAQVVEDSKAAEEELANSPVTESGEFKPEEPQTAQTSTDTTEGEKSSPELNKEQLVEKYRDELVDLQGVSREEADKVNFEDIPKDYIYENAPHLVEKKAEPVKQPKAKQLTEEEQNAKTLIDSIESGENTLEDVLVYLNQEAQDEDNDIDSINKVKQLVEAHFAPKEEKAVVEPTITEQLGIPESLPTISDTVEEKPYDERDAMSSTGLRTTSSYDDAKAKGLNSVLRFQNFLTNPKNNVLASGYRLKVITPSNSLYTKIQNKSQKAFEEKKKAEGETINGIYAVLVDENDNLLLADFSGEIFNSFTPEEYNSSKEEVDDLFGEVDELEGILVTTLVSNINQKESGFNAVSYKNFGKNNGLGDAVTEEDIKNPSHPAHKAWKEHEEEVKNTRQSILAGKIKYLTLDAITTGIPNRTEGQKELGEVLGIDINSPEITYVLETVDSVEKPGYISIGAKYGLAKDVEVQKGRPYAIYKGVVYPLTTAKLGNSEATKIAKQLEDLDITNAEVVNKTLKSIGRIVYIPTDTLNAILDKKLAGEDLVEYLANKFRQIDRDFTKDTKAGRTYREKVLVGEKAILTTNMNPQPTNPNMEPNFKNPYIVYKPVYEVSEPAKEVEDNNAKYNRLVDEIEEKYRKLAEPLIKKILEVPDDFVTFKDTGYRSGNIKEIKRMISGSGMWGYAASHRYFLGNEPGVKELGDLARQKVLDLNKALKESGVKKMDTRTAKEREADKPVTKTVEEIVQNTTTDSKEDRAKKRAAAREAAKLAATTIKLERKASLQSSDKKEDITEAKKWFSDRFNGESFEVVDNLINGNSFGEYTQAATRLYTGAEKGTIYHEAFHKVTQEYLTPKQIKSLYDAVRKNINPKFSDLECEEWLAEEFRNFVLNGQKAIKNMPYTNNIFRKIYNWIKSLVTRKTTPQQVFDKLASKKGYTGAKKFNNQQFTKLERAFPGLTHQQTQNILDSVNGYFFNVLFNNNKTPDQLINSTSTYLPAIYKAVANTMYIDYSYEEEAFDEGDLTEAEFLPYKQHYDFALVYNEKGEVVGLNEVVKDAHIKYLKTVGIYLNENVADKSDAEDRELNSEAEVKNEESNDSRTRDTAYDKNSAEESPFDSAPSSIKMLVMSLPDIDREGNAITNNIGGPKLVNTQKTFNMLYDNLKGLTTFEDMYAKLESISTRFPVVKQLMERVGAPATNKDFHHMMLENDFRQAFSKFESRGTVTLIDEATGKIYQVDANQNKLRDRIKENWNANLRGLANTDSPYVGKNEEGVITIKPKLIEDLRAKKFVGKPLDLFKAIGIEFTDLTNEQLAAYPNIETIRAAIAKQLIKLFDEGTPINDLYAEEVDIKGRIKALLDIEQNLSKETVELSYLNAEGKRIYAISLNNYYSLAVNKLNNARTLDELFRLSPHLNNPFTKNSQWIKALFDERGNKRAGVRAYMNTQAGLKIEGKNDSGVGSTKMEPSDKIVQEFNDGLGHGTFSLIRAADKSSEFSFGISYYGEEKSKLVIPLDSIPDKGLDTPQIREVFFGYFMDELETIRAFRGKNKVGANIAIYGQKSDKEKEGSEPANNFRLFADILSSETLSELEAYKTSDKVIPASLQAKIEQETVKYLSQYAAEVKTYIQDRKVGLKTTNGFTGISPEFTGTSEVGLNRAIKAFTVNHLIQMQEQAKLLVGDSAFYKDKFKRISAGTGCLGYGTKIIMYDGSIKEVQDIEVGDKLMSPDGSSRNVLSLARGVEQMYLVHQKKGITYRVNESHIISLRERPFTGKYTNKEGITTFYKYNTEEKIVNRKLTDLLKEGNKYFKVHKGWKANNVFNFSRNITEEVTIDPYYFGLWLGDGCQSSPINITNVDIEVIDYLKQYANDLGLQLTTCGIQHKITCGVNSNRHLKGNVLLNECTRLKMQDRKTILPQYLFGSEEVRLQVLAGLIDSDGNWRAKDNAFHIPQIRYELSKEIALLARSLGYCVTETVKPFGIDKRGIKHQEAYVVNITGNDLDKIPTKIARKQAPKLESKKDLYVSGITLEKDTIDNYYGFELDGDHLFLLEDFTVTHNTKKFAADSVNQNNWLNSFYKSSESNNRVDGKVADGKVKTVIFGDVKTQQANIDEYIDALVESGVSEEEAKGILAAYTNMDEGDAQGWITLDEYREFMMRVGGAYWTDKHEKQYQYEKALENGDTSLENPHFYFMPIKAQHFGPQNIDGIYAPAFHKYSLAPLIPSLVKGRNMEKLLTSMRKNQVGYALFGSGSKVGTPLDASGKLPSFYNSEGELAGIQESTPIQEIFYENLGIQLDIAPKVKDKLIFGSQFRKLIMSNLFGENVREWAKPLLAEWNSIIDNLVNKELDDVTSKLGLKVIKDKEGNYQSFTFNGDHRKLVAKLKAQLDDKDTADNILDSLQVNEDGSLKYPIDSLVNRQKIEAMLFSIVNNKVIKQKTLGNSLVQLASSGFEKAGKRTVGESNYLQFYRKDSSIKPSDRIIFGHPTIGKTFLKSNGENRFISLDDDYAQNIKEFIAANKKPDEDKYQYQERKPKEFIDFTLQLFDKAKERAIKENKQLFTSNNIILDKRGNEFDKVVNLDREEFFKRIAERNTTYDVKAWKDQIDSLISKIDSSKVIKTSGYLSELFNDGRTLPMEVEVPMNKTFAPLLKQFNGDLEALNKAIEEGKVDAKYLQMIGYRIPTQGLNSMDFMQIKRFMPEASGIAIILPTGVVAKSGGDYDIDKLNIFMPHIPDFKQENREFAKTSKEAMQNRIISIAAEVLSHKDNFTDLITPNTTDTLLNLVAEIRKAQGKGKVEKASPTKEFRFDWIMEQFTYFLGGKAGVGIGAVHNTHHILSQIAKVKLDTKLPFKSNTDKEQLDLSREYTQGGQKISDIISQFINAYVDVAKDPFYKDLNAGTEVAGIWFYLLRAGVDVNTIGYFMTQPIIKEYVNAKKLNNSLVTKSNKLQKLDKSVSEETIEKAKSRLKDLQEALEEGSYIFPEAGYYDESESGKPLTRGEIKEEIAYKTKVVNGSIYNDVISKYGTDAKVEAGDFTYDDINKRLLEFIKEGATKTEFSYGFKYNQTQLLNAFLEIEAQSKELTSLMQVTNMDTTKLQNFGSVEQLDRKVEKVENSAIIPKGTRQRILDATIVGSFNKANTFREMYKELTLATSIDEVKTAMKPLIDGIIDNTKSKDFNKEYVKLQNDFIGYITQKFGKTLDGQPLLTKMSLLSNTISNNVDTSQYTNYSGKAIGSDTEWENVAKENGIKTTNYTTDSLSKLKSENIKEVEEAYQQAAKDLGRGVLNSDSYSGKLVRRDYLQAKAADAIFAIGNIMNPGENSSKVDKSGNPYKVRSKHQSVDGGTGYATQMAINLGKPVHVFNQRDNKWYKWNYSTNSFESISTPTLTPKFAGIGTREITKEGKQAIREVFKNSLQQTIQQASLAQQLVALRKEGLADITENAFVKELVAQISADGKLDTVKLWSRRMKAMDSNIMTDAFRQLIESNNPKISEFGRNLIYATILQSGLQNSPITFTELIPFEYYANLVKNAIDSAVLDKAEMEKFTEAYYYKQVNPNYKVQDFGLTVSPQDTSNNTEEQSDSVVDIDSSVATYTQTEQEYLDYDFTIDARLEDDNENNTERIKVESMSSQEYNPYYSYSQKVIANSTLGKLVNRNGSISIDTIFNFIEEYATTSQKEMGKILRSIINKNTIKPVFKLATEEQINSYKQATNYNDSQFGDIAALATLSEYSISININAFDSINSIAQRQQLSSILNHEIIHLLTLGELYEKKEFYKEVESLMQRVIKARPSAKAYYGMTNPYEFVTEALTNQDFQYLLNQIQGDIKNNGKTVWNKFVELLRQIFDNSVDYSILDETLALISYKIDNPKFNTNEFFKSEFSRFNPSSQLTQIRNMNKAEEDSDNTKECKL